MSTKEHMREIYEAEETIDLAGLGDRIMHEGTELYFAGCSWGEVKETIVASYHLAGDHFQRRDFTMHELFSLASLRKVMPARQ